MTVSIGLGLSEFPFRDAAGYWRWVDLCEAEGVDSLWQTDRIVSRAPILESMTAMAALAGRTRRIKFGMNVVSIAFRDPVLLAKQCATIDVLSAGRLLPAFGIGSPHSPEWSALSVDQRTRGRRTDEGLEIIRRLWTEERVDFDGAFHKLKGVSILPRPVQPDLPMWIGGSSAAAIARTARAGTGWIAGAEAPAEAGRVADAIRAAARAAGRTIEDDHYGAGIAFHFGRPDEPPVAAALEAFRRRTGRDPAEQFAIGDADSILAAIAAYVAAGIEKFILRPLVMDPDQVQSQTERLVREVLPRAAAPWPRARKGE